MKILALNSSPRKGGESKTERMLTHLVQGMQEKGAEVHYNDPHIPQLKPVRKYSFSLKSMELTAKTLATMDCILLATDHSAYDYRFILDHADLIIDTRNAFNGLQGAAGKVVQA